LGLKADLVFLNPDYIEEDDKKFSIFTGIFPNIVETMKNALNIADNIIILFPAFIDIHEIPILFNMF
jgi:hypothetical protein